MAGFQELEKAGWERTVNDCYAACRPVTHRLIAPLLDAARVSAGSRVLDVGTGPGDVAAEAAERGAEVIGLDFARAMISLAQLRAAGFDPTSVTMIGFTIRPVSVDSLWISVLAATVRTASTITRESPAVQQLIRAAFDRLTDDYLIKDGLADQTKSERISWAVTRARICCSVGPPS